MAPPVDPRRQIGVWEYMVTPRGKAEGKALAVAVMCIYLLYYHSEYTIHFFILGFATLALGCFQHTIMFIFYSTQIVDLVRHVQYAL